MLGVEVYYFKYLFLQKSSQNHKGENQKNTESNQQKSS